MLNDIGFASMSVKTYAVQKLTECSLDETGFDCKIKQQNRLFHT